VAVHDPSLSLRYGWHVIDRAPSKVIIPSSPALPIIPMKKGWRAVEPYGLPSCSRHSGKNQMTIRSPQFTPTLGPFYKTELFAGVGMRYL
jgi:hypothetical protein